MFVVQQCKLMVVARPFSSGLIKLLLNGSRTWSNEQVCQPVGSHRCVQVGAWKDKNLMECPC